MQGNALVVAEAEGPHVLSCPCWTKSLQERKKGQDHVTTQPHSTEEQYVQGQIKRQLPVQVILLVRDLK